jgi:hypothetical protein
MRCAHLALPFFDAWRLGLSGFPALPASSVMALPSIASREQPYLFVGPALRLGQSRESYKSAFI